MPQPTFQLENQYLRISVKQTGAELSGIRSVTSGLEYLWDGDPAVWPSHAPVLFPIVGELKEGTYYYQGQAYPLARHGFVRNNERVVLEESTPTSLTFLLQTDDETLARYPFRFAFRVKYLLEGNRIRVSHEVTNLDEVPMLFSVGGHPAFRCPIHPTERYDDYYLEFEVPETAPIWPINDKGLLTGETVPLLDQSTSLPLRHDLFENDALIFKNLQSKKITLRSHKSPQRVTVHFADFPYLGIWAKPQGDYVCIEPWLGIADRADADQQLEHKEAIQRLEAGQTFEASFIIEISE
ncbi:aldose 1-epimerase family protein [Rhabdobacter roseus]|uniref:Galactose mutarotase-like enzyme n=1 Tax=Rhabdobacter roseus TaxID=1655419 RepID=A0A840TSS0_9BACT|nr:aldose 1-epimerase family protein [Rhabdobacter roseus]MBB5283050.1 galactose mutarotase-like enzyme [Rhabdobacter roseus]